MNGRQLYEQHRDLQDAFGLTNPDWDDLTPVRQAIWELSAKDYVSKRLDDDAETRMTDEGGPAND